ncbi:MAG: ion channel DMI1 [Bacteroidetes bacterium]|jgi:hypothetical protein|nr:ion channel DMI1 [Bacteroidota bacterium]
MIRRLKDRLKFMLERWIQRGALNQLLLMVALVMLVVAVGGLLAWGLTDAFEHPGTALWWAFLRLTDPGYLGDDQGTTLRIISTVVTVLGYILFMGSLIAILTQWLRETMITLESGLTPITLSDHILVLGWTNRTPAIVRELLLSEGRVQRFLHRRGARRLRIVILAEHVDAQLRQELRDALGSSLKRGQIIFRSGTSMRIEHLQRVDFTNAAAILLPGADFALGGAEATDTRVIKTLMSIAKYGREALSHREPAIMAEIFDAQKAPIARQAYPHALNILAGDAFVSRLIAQNVRHSGLSYVYAELLSYSHGNEAYIRAWPEFTGQPLQAITEAFPKALLLGAVRPGADGFVPHLNPSPDFVLREDDRLVLIARRYEDAVPAEGVAPADAVKHLLPAPEVRLQRRRRLLFLGWSHKVIALVQEFGSYPTEYFDIDVLSVVPADEREARLAHVDVDPERVQVRQLEGDYTLRADLLAAEPATYDNVVFLGSDWLDSDEESDARTILGYVLLCAVLPVEDTSPEILVELSDPANARLFLERPGEVVISPLVLSHVLAHATLRQELTVVFEELFGPGGAEIFFRPVADYGLDGQTTFRHIQHAAAQRGEIALGVRRAAEINDSSGGVSLNPALDAEWHFQTGDEIVVLTTYD